MRAEVVERRRAIVARLLELKAKKQLNTATVEVAARSAGVSVRSVWRWLANGEYHPGKRDGWKMTPEAIEVLYMTGGRPIQARRILRDHGVDVPAKSQFCDAVNRDISRAELAYMQTGEEGRRRYSVYRRWEPRDRNEVWETDHAMLDIEILPPRGVRLVRPWITEIIDGYSRVIMGWVLSLQPRPRRFSPRSVKQSQ